MDIIIRAAYAFLFAFICNIGVMLLMSLLRRYSVSEQMSEVYAKVDVVEPKAEFINQTREKTKDLVIKVDITEEKEESNESENCVREMTR